MALKIKSAPSFLINLTIPLSDVSTSENIWDIDMSIVVIDGSFLTFLNPPKRCSHLETSGTSSHSELSKFRSVVLCSESINLFKFKSPSQGLAESVALRWELSLMARSIDLIKKSSSLTPSRLSAEWNSTSWLSSTINDILPIFKLHLKLSS